tara:strand:+ start:168 stop:1193 length:1026 start_codon:yes stop_codon:yes gene_type:complete
LDGYTGSIVVRIYKTFIKPILFQIPAERAHNLAKVLFKIGLLWEMFKFFLSFKDKALNTYIGNVCIDNPVGLAAGYDKDCVYIKPLSNIGFGYIIGGTVLLKPQPGNPKPRIARNPETLSMINSLGFPSMGLNEVENNLRNITDINIPIFASISGLSIEDFLECFKRLQPITSGIELNISSPNTSGIRIFQEANNLENLLSTLQEVKTKPVFLKIPMYFDENERRAVMTMVDLCVKYSVDGVTASNTWPREDPRLAVGRGGLSGKPLFQHTLRIVKDIREHSGEKFIINACGGIFTGEDALDALAAGANTVQIYTGFIYEGPSVVRNINKKLAESTKRPNT